MADEASITAARQALGQKTDVLDVLINNAGILGTMAQPPLSASLSMIKEVAVV